MQFKKIILAMLAIVSVLSISLFAVSCERENKTDDSSSQSVTDSASDPQSSSVGEQFGYRVEYYKQKIDGEGYDVSGIPMSALSGSTVTAEIPSYDGFTHVTTEESKESGVLDSNNSLVLKVYYNRNKYKLSLSSEDIETEISGAGEYYYQSTVSVSATNIPGYIFKGWFDGDNADPVNENRQFTYTVEKDASLKAVWEPSNVTLYEVQYYQEKIDRSGYDLFETKGFTGVTGDTAKATVKNYKGFSHDENNENALESGVIAGDNSLVLSVYYNRETYTVTLNGGDNAIETVGEGEYLYGTEVAVSVTSVGGFEFICWAENDQTFNTGYKFTLTVESDITLDAKWKQTVFISSVTQPQSLTNYYSNRKLKPETPRNEFAFNDNPYYVGDDNAFTMMPVVSFVDGNDDPVEQPSDWGVDKWTFNVSLEIKNKLDNFVKVVDNDLYIESIDENNCSIDFNEDAIGEIFRIYIFPVGLASWQKDDLSDFSTNFEITVIDGYNATTALDLAYINKIENNAVKDYVTGYSDKDIDITFNGGAKWNDFAGKKGIDLSTDHHAIILHNDITVTKADVPEYYFYDVTVDENVKPSDVDYGRINGSLKDYVDVYYRKLSANENFIIEGNYFTLNCGSFPLVVRERDTATPLGATFESHSQIFRFVSDKNDDTAKIEIRNINLVGNASKTENTQKAGGLILLKATHVSLKAENNISNQWYINYFPDDNENRVDINYCRAYDSFNSIMYVWGASDVHIDHCDFNGAGGPVFIVDHIHQDNQQLYTGLPSWIEVTNSKMHSFVTGTEAWFDMYNASSIASLLKDMSAAFNPFGKTYVVENKNNSKIKYLDLIAVYKAAGEGISEAMNVTGYFNMNGATCPMDFGTYNLPAIAESDQALATKMQVLSGTIEAAKPKGTVVFVSSKSTLNVTKYGDNYMAEGAAIFGGASVGLVDGFMQQITDPTNPIFQGDQLYIYTALGLSAVVGYYDYGTTVDPAVIGEFISTRN
ncbi:MAG: hypothetical protein J6T42_01805 [Clostridia bacterium]|nr:hypothetical protein [Clostridia bacterium]